MKRYIVDCIQVGGKSNKVFNFEEIVSEDQFLEGHAEAYVKSGHLKVHKPTKAELAADKKREEANAVYIDAVKAKAKAEADFKLNSDSFAREEAALETSEKTKLEVDKAFEASKATQESAEKELSEAEIKQTSDAGYLEEAAEVEKKLPKTAGKKDISSAKGAVKTFTDALKHSVKVVEESAGKKQNADAAFDTAKKIQTESIKSLGLIQKAYDAASDKKDESEANLKSATTEFEEAAEVKNKAYK